MNVDQIKSIIDDAILKSDKRIESLKKDVELLVENGCSKSSIDEHGNWLKMELYAYHILKNVEQSIKLGESI